MPQGSVGAVISMISMVVSSYERATVLEQEIIVGMALIWVELVSNGAAALIL